GMETCCTLGMLKDGQAEALKEAGLDYYNHNLDTSPEFYGDVITTRDYDDRLDTLARVRSAGLLVCCGGIVGMGESRTQRAGLVAGANSIFYGDKLLTTGNPEVAADRALLASLGLSATDASNP